MQYHLMLLILFPLYRVVSYLLIQDSNPLMHLMNKIPHLIQRIEMVTMLAALSDLFLLFLHNLFLSVYYLHQHNMIYIESNTETNHPIHNLINKTCFREVQPCRQQQIVTHSFTIPPLTL